VGASITNCRSRTAKRRAKSVSAGARNDEFTEEIRQMSVGRYRVLFTIKAAESTYFMSEARISGRLRRKMTSSCLLL
jgi:hypothetical protein